MLARWAQLIVECADCLAAPSIPCTGYCYLFTGNCWDALVSAAAVCRQVGRTFSVRSERVRPAPQPPSRELVPLPPPKGRPLAPGGKFTLLTYNLLADLYATVGAVTCLRCCSQC